MTITNVYAVIAVADIDAALAWYERLLGRPADAIPMDGLAQWQLTESGGLQLVRDADHAGSTQMTVIVDDLTSRMTDLAGRGLTDGTITTGVVASFAAVTDPEGNTITFAEAINGR